MTVRLPAMLALAASLGLCRIAPAQEPATPEPAAAVPDAKTQIPAAKAEKAKPKIETATFGAGCFWSTEAVFELIPGVKSVTSGFSGGNVPSPSYKMVCTGETGHAEVVHVEFDPSLVTYESLLGYYWKSHDPTTLNSQGADFGTQYRSVIFYHSPEQKAAALKSAEELRARRAYRSPIVTQLLPFESFYPAEPEHQDFFRNNRYSEYSQFNIVPKLKKLHLTGSPAARTKPSR